MTQPLSQGGGGAPSDAEVIAELRSAAIAIRLFGLDALSHVLKPAPATDQLEPEDQ